MVTGSEPCEVTVSQHQQTSARRGLLLDDAAAADHVPRCTANLEACHNTCHGSIGGSMGNIPTAALDPIFYLHHCFVDLLARQWQVRPRGLPAWWAAGDGVTE
jgi:hypothetical protein